MNDRQKIIFRIVAIVLIVLALFALFFTLSTREKEKTIRPVINAVVPRVYFPAARKDAGYYGLAIAVDDSRTPADLRDLGVSWWYNYSPTISPGYIPMLWNCNISASVPANWTGEILVCNEPDRIDQANTDPVVASVIVAGVNSHYPNAVVVCCNLSIGGLGWLQSFYNTGVRPDIWSVHAYTSPSLTVADLENKITAMHNLTGGDYWVTEYGILSGDAGQFQSFTEWLIAQPYIKRIAPFTNRQPHTGEPWEMPAGVELYYFGTNNLTPVGIYYKSIANLMP